ncbi:MAG: heparan-alpha-glucosaminide N-acetyltransferase domain-containing protein [Gemmiger sp.]
MNSRIWQVDALRGLALLNMLAYHALYDWVYVFGHTGGWYNISSPGCHVWQQYICWSFILLSGYSFALSRDPRKNGLLTAGCAVLLGAVTILCMPGEAIWFGVLHFNACAVLLTCLARPLLAKCPAAAGLAASAALFALTNQLPWGWLGFEGWRLAALPPALYRANLYWLGLPDLTRFSSADYFPLLPWLFLFWCGVFAGRLWRPRAAAPPAALRPLCAVGARTLLVYIAHQPVIYGALWLYHGAIC